MEKQYWIILGVAVLVLAGVFIAGLLTGYMTTCDPCQCSPSGLIDLSSINVIAQ